MTSSKQIHPDKSSSNRAFEYCCTVFMVLFTASIINGCGARKIPPSGQPNIILILADDIGYGDPQAYNPQSGIPTPNIDRLARQGMRFTDAHAAAPWCLPSRYGLLTGRYPFHISTKWKSQSIIASRQLTVATLLKQRGYRTGMIGKWHEGFSNFTKWNHDGYKGSLKGGPTDRGFDYYYGIPASLDIPPYFYIENNHAVRPPTDSIRASHSPGVTAIQGAFWRAGKIAPGFKHAQVLPRLTRKALGFIDRQKPKNKPFFLYFALTAPHTPWLPSKRFRGRSGAGSYGDFVMQVDGVVGQIMKKMKQKGIEKNTILIFSSDNGPVWFQADVKRTGHRSTAMLRGMKIDSWEGGHRVPFIVRWPGKVKAGSYSDALLDFTDMMATFAAVAGDYLPQTGNISDDSYNQLPVWEGKQSSVRSILPVANSLRKGDWKLIDGHGLGGLHRRYGTHKNLGPAKGELYDLKGDISEQHNLYRAHPERVRRMQHLRDSLEQEETERTPEPSGNAEE